MSFKNQAIICSIESEREGDWETAFLSCGECAVGAMPGSLEQGCLMSAEQVLGRNGFQEGRGGEEMLDKARAWWERGLIFLEGKCIPSLKCLICRVPSSELHVGWSRWRPGWG